jgi:hypothetical protein
MVLGAGGDATVGGATGAGTPGATGRMAVAVATGGGSGRVAPPVPAGGASGLGTVGAGGATATGGRTGGGTAATPEESPGVAFRVMRTVSLFRGTVDVLVSGTGSVEVLVSGAWFGSLMLRFFQNSLPLATLLIARKPKPMSIGFFGRSRLRQSSGGRGREFFIS